MADTKWSALPTVANLLDSDRLTLVRDPTGARTPSTIPGSVLKSELAAYFDTLYQPADAQLDVYAGIAPSGFGQSWIQLTNAAAGRVALGVRDTLSGTRTYYVRTDGSDSNDGLANTAGGAFLTIAKGISAAYAIDTSLYNVVIQLADGTYSAGALAARPFVGLGAITIQGNAGTPANVIVSVANNNVFVSQYGANIHIKDLTMVTTGTGGYHMAADSGGGITFANVRFGAVAGSYSHIYSNSAGRVTCLGNYAIVGGAQAHFYSINMSYIFVAGMTVTLTGEALSEDIHTCSGRNRVPSSRVMVIGSPAVPG